MREATDVSQIDISIEGKESIAPLWDILAQQSHRLKSIVQRRESGIPYIYCYGFKGIRRVESELEVRTHDIFR